MNPADADTIFAAAAGELTPPLAAIALADLATHPPAPVAWALRNLIPLGEVTLFGAHGGAGKTHGFALQLGICTAAGLPMLEIETRRARVVFYSAEDDGEQMRRGIHRICTHLRIEPANLDGWLHVLDVTEGDPVLYQEITDHTRRHGATTPAFDALLTYVKQHRPGLVIIDNASDVYDASEIDRARVRGFVRALRRLAKAAGGAVLLLAHVDKGTSRGERKDSEGYSGSTAWHNSARSRLYLSRDKDGLLTLEHQKSNRGPLCEPIRVEWPTDGVMQRPATGGGMVAAIEARSDTKALLRLVHEFSGRGDHVSTSTTGRGAAPAMFAKEPSFPQSLKPADVFDLLRRAERLGLIAREEFKTRQRKWIERWALTDEGRATIGAPNAPNPAPNEFGAIGAGGAPNAPNGAGGVGGSAARTYGARKPQ